MKPFLLLLITYALCGTAMADVRLSKIFGNNMVLQRNKSIPVWGWADAGEKITIQFNKQVKKTTCGKSGKWQIELTAEIAGGPYQLTATGKNRIILNNILIGEVWICSGQSNMEMTVSSSQHADMEIRSGDFPQIRHIKIPNTISGTPVIDVAPAEWQIAKPATVGNFSAVAYFFARKVFKELNIPVGIINSSWGGSMIETWISGEALERSDDFKNTFKEVSFNDIEAKNNQNFQNIIKEIEASEGVSTPVISQKEWQSQSLDYSRWKKINLPVSFNEAGLQKFDGTMWLRKTIHVKKEAMLQPAVINLSTIDDMDETYINGQLVGSSNTYSDVRQYNVAAGILKEGNNVVAIRVTDNNGNGGFFGKPADINLTCANQVIPLAGEWFYKIEAFKRSAPNPNSYPSILFNAMINPLLPFAIKGVLWYQGETNAERAHQYKNAFPLLINDWRSRFKHGDFPFYFVQLASYRANNGNSAKGSDWAELREAQTQTLSLPNTGMSVTLDIGETNDIHPANKQDVGERLAAIALSQQYKKNIPYSGPVYQSMQVAGNKAILSFLNIDAGYLVKDNYGYIKGFEISGADKKFYFARAYIQKDKVVVNSDSVAAPVAVRYGWADDMPEANLYNKHGFPAGPFRTDNWPGITDKVKYTVTY